MQLLDIDQESNPHWLTDEIQETMLKSFAQQVLFQIPYCYESGAFNDEQLR
jgi:hypothetical protein